MKFKSLIIVLCCLFSLLSCKNAEMPIEEIEFLFKDIQPLNDSEISSFPNRFVGEFIDKDSTLLIISKKKVYYKQYLKSKISFTTFDSIIDSLKIVQNKIYLTDKKYVEYRKLKDSIEITDFYYDTIFSISENQKVTKINKIFTLNTKDSLYWKIKFLIFDKNKVTIKSLYSNNDILRLDSLSKIKSQKLDSIKSLFQLSRKEFKTMLTLKKMGYDKDFTKINN